MDLFAVLELDNNRLLRKCLEKLLLSFFGKDKNLVSLPEGQMILFDVKGQCVHDSKLSDSLPRWQYGTLILH